MASPYSVVLITAPDRKTADTLTHALLGGKFAACVNQVPKLRSRYWWKGKIETAEELLLLVKTRSSLIPEVARCVRENHPYSVPEVISLAIADGHKPYLDWIGASTRLAPPHPRGARSSHRAHGRGK